MDLVSDAIWSTRLGRPTSDTVRMEGSWSVRMPAYRGLAFLSVTKGSLWVAPENGEAVRVDDGAAILMVSRGRTFRFSDSRPHVDTPFRHSVEFADWRRLHRTPRDDRGDDSEATEILCGKYRLHDAGLHPFLMTLPELTIVTGQPDGPPDFGAALAMLSSAQGDQRPGHAVALRGLLDVIFLFLLRAVSEGSAAGAGIRAPTDAAVVAALRALNDNPAAPWTSERLARLTGVSRPTLNRHFSRSLGVSPMAYVSRWRLAYSAHLLVSTTRTLSSIALAVGYASASSFSHAFTKAYGLGPGRFRSTHAGR